MNIKLKQILIASLLAVGIISLSACSDDDDKSASSNKGTVTTANARSLVIASAQGTNTQQQAGNMSASEMTAVIQPALISAITNTTAVNLGFIECDGQSGTYEANGFVQTNLNGSILFKNYCVVLSNPGAASDQFTLNGTLMINISATSKTNFSVFISFSNFSATYNNVTTQFVGSITINNSGTVPDIEFSYSTNVTSEEQTFQIGDLNVVVNDGSIDIDGSLTADSMTYDIQSTTPLVFDATCTNGAPTSGTIKLVGVNGTSATATFDAIGNESCNTFTLCVIEAGKPEACSTAEWVLSQAAS